MNEITQESLMKFLDKHCIYKPDIEEPEVERTLCQDHELIMVAGIIYYMPCFNDLWTEHEQEIVKHLRTYCQPFK